VTTRTAAHRYARALFDVGLREQQDLDGLERQLNAFLELLRQHPSLEKVLLNPAVPTPRKRDAVAALVPRLGLQTIVAKLLVLLAERDRLIVLPDLVVSFRDRRLDYQKVARAEVTTAVPLPESRAAAIERSLAQATGRTVTLVTRVDPSIIGGLVARVGSTVYDGSVATQLQKMRQKLAGGR
jgi:F-type H+-transporting ATPase subunit delta